MVLPVQPKAGFDFARLEWSAGSFPALSSGKGAERKSRPNLAFGGRGGCVLELSPVEELG
jgi:hypothetical protein